MGHVKAVHYSSEFHYSEADLNAIREQVERICANPLFSQSKRYPALLRYIVEQSLTGHQDELKERTIGVEVFHRSSDYDSNADPAVRIAAGEVRKRLAQYYYEPGREKELRIELPVGTYVPSFKFPNRRETLPFSSPPAGPPARSPTPRKKRVWWIAALGTLAVVVLLSAFSLRSTSPNTISSPKTSSSSFDQFWNQVVFANGSVQLCLGGWVEEQPTGPGLAVTLSTYESLGKFTDLFKQRRKRYLNTLHVVGPGEISLSGFLDGPVLYVGFYKPLASTMATWRYSFQREPSSRTLWVHDKEAEFERRWRTELVPPQQRSESYAIVTRLLDRDLNRPVIVVAGVHSFATVGAITVLTEPDSMEELLRDAPSNWQEMNFQAVVETRLENDNPGPPRIVAKHFWK